MDIEEGEEICIFEEDDGTERVYLPLGHIREKAFVLSIEDEKLACQVEEALLAKKHTLQKNEHVLDGETDPEVIDGIKRVCGIATREHLAQTNTQGHDVIITDTSVSLFGRTLPARILPVPTVSEAWEVHGSRAQKRADIRHVIWVSENDIPCELPGILPLFSAGNWKAPLKPCNNITNHMSDCGLTGKESYIVQADVKLATMAESVHKQKLALEAIKLNRDAPFEQKKIRFVHEEKITTNLLPDDVDYVKFEQGDDQFDTSICKFILETFNVT